MKLISALSILAMVTMFAGVASAAYPNSMAVIGDSISRAALADNTIDQDQPEHSWSTGTDAADACNSHWERIKLVVPGVVGYNNAVNGSRADDLLGQANTTVANGAQYVTIEMGGNDVCRDTAAEMTPVATYTAYWNEAIDVLQAGLPSAKILVCEVVNVGRVWDVGNTNFGCRYIKWPLFGFCKSMLQNGTTERNLAKTRNVEYCNALRTLSAAQGVYFDDDVYEVAFSRSQLSSVDCFHPAIACQALLANATYDATRFN
jgi:lysophospholipase L1-like esterase